MTAPFPVPYLDQLTLPDERLARLKALIAQGSPPSPAPDLSPPDDRLAKLKALVAAQAVTPGEADVAKTTFGETPASSGGRDFFQTPEVTPIPANRQQEYKEWLARNQVQDADNPDAHYDYPGAFLAGIEGRSANGHWPDTFKQHGHPTFSVESEYSTGPDDGGRWQGDTYQPPGPRIMASSEMPTATPKATFGSFAKQYGAGLGGFGLKLIPDIAIQTARDFARTDDVAAALMQGSSVRQALQRATEQEGGNGIPSTGGSIFEKLQRPIDEGVTSLENRVVGKPTEPSDVVGRQAGEIAGQAVTLLPLGMSAAERVLGRVSREMGAIRSARTAEATIPPVQPPPPDPQPLESHAQPNPEREPVPSTPLRTVADVQKEIQGATAAAQEAARRGSSHLATQYQQHANKLMRELRTMKEVTPSAPVEPTTGLPVEAGPSAPPVQPLDQQLDALKQRVAKEGVPAPKVDLSGLHLGQIESAITDRITPVKEQGYSLGNGMFVKPEDLIGELRRRSIEGKKQLEDIELTDQPGKAKYWLTEDQARIERLIQQASRDLPKGRKPTATGSPTPAQRQAAQAAFRVGDQIIPTGSVHRETLIPPELAGLPVERGFVTKAGEFLTPEQAGLAAKKPTAADLLRKTDAEMEQILHPSKGLPEGVSAPAQRASVEKITNEAMDQSAVDELVGEQTAKDPRLEKLKQIVKSKAHPDVTAADEQLFNEWENVFPKAPKGAKPENRTMATEFRGQSIMDAEPMIREREAAIRERHGLPGKRTYEDNPYWSAFHSKRTLGIDEARKAILGQVLRGGGGTRFTNPDTRLLLLSERGATDEEIAALVRHGYNDLEYNGLKLPTEQGPVEIATPSREHGVGKKSKFAPQLTAPGRAPETVDIPMLVRQAREEYGIGQPKGVAKAKPIPAAERFTVEPTEKGFGVRDRERDALIEEGTKGGKLRTRHFPTQEAAQAWIDEAVPAVQHAADVIARREAKAKKAEPLPTSVSHAETGKPFKARLMRGEGREGSPYNPLGAQVPILGKAKYTTPEREFAEHFGPNVTEHDVSLKNPLVIENDKQWGEITQDAGWKYSNPFGGDPDMVAGQIARLRARIERQGHDGVVIKLDPRGDYAKTLRKVFGADQAIEFHPESIAEGSKRPKVGDTFHGEPVYRELRPDHPLKEGYAYRDAKGVDIRIPEIGATVSARTAEGKVAEGTLEWAKGESVRVRFADGTKNNGHFNDVLGDTPVAPKTAKQPGNAQKGVPKRTLKPKAPAPAKPIAFRQGVDQMLERSEAGTTDLGLLLTKTQRLIDQANATSDPVELRRIHSQIRPLYDAAGAGDVRGGIIDIGAAINRKIKKLLPPEPKGPTKVKQAVVEGGNPKFRKMDNDALIARRHELIDRIDAQNRILDKNVTPFARDRGDGTVVSGTSVNQAAGRAIGQIKTAGRILGELDEEFKVRGISDEQLADALDARTEREAIEADENIKPGENPPGFTAFSHGSIGGGIIGATAGAHADEKHPGRGALIGAIAGAALGTRLTKVLNANPTTAGKLITPGIKDDILTMLAPASRGGGGEEAGYIMRHRLGEQAASEERARESLKGFRRIVAHLGKTDTYRFIDHIEQGQIDLLPKPLQPIAHALRKVLDETRDEIIALGNGRLTHFYETYFPHIWKDPNQAKDVIKQILGKRPLEGNKNFLRKRSIVSVSEGLEHGLELATDNPLDLVLLKHREMRRYLMGQRVLNDFKEEGLAKFVKAREAHPDGYRRIDDRVAEVRGPGPRGSITIRGHYWAPEPVARVINNHLSPGLRGRPLYDGYMYIGNLMNQVQLGISAFHLGFTSLDATVSKVALGILELKDGHPIKAAKAFAEAPVAPITNFRRGAKLRHAYLNGVDDKIVEGLIEGGGRVRMDSFWRTNAAESFLHAVQDRSPKGIARHAIPAVFDASSKFILDFVVPRQKLGVFADLYSRELARLPGDATPMMRKKLASKVWDSVDNRMGQMVYDNLFWNRTLKDLAFASVRSVGWNLGTIRELGGGALDLSKGQMSYRASYAIALPLTVGLMGAITTYLYTGHGPRSLKDYFLPPTGKVNEDGNEERVQLPSYVKDVIAYRRHPLETLGHKAQPFLATIIDMLNNRDYYGDQIRNRDDPVVTQAIQAATYLAKQFIPFGIRNAMQEQTHRQSTSTKVGPFFGMTPAPRELVRSPAQQRMAQILGDRGFPMRTPEEVKASGTRRTMLEEFRAGRLTKHAIADSARAGVMSHRQALDMQRRGTEPNIVSRFKQLRWAQAEDVYSRANADERKLWWPILWNKRSDALDQLLEAGNKTPEVDRLRSLMHRDHLHGPPPTTGPP